MCPRTPLCSYRPTNNTVAINPVVSVIGHRLQISTTKIVFISYASSWSPPKKLTLAHWNHLCYWRIQTTLSRGNQVEILNSFFLAPHRGHPSTLGGTEPCCLLECRALRIFLPLVTTSIYHNCWSRPFLAPQKHGPLGWTIIPDFCTVNLVHLSFLACSVFISTVVVHCSSPKYRFISFHRERGRLTRWISMSIYFCTSKEPGVLAASATNLHFGLH